MDDAADLDPGGPALFLRHLAAMHEAARSVLGSDEEARDVVQDAYVRLSGRLESWRGTGPLRAWLCVIARRIAIDRRRGPRLDPTRVARPGPAPDPSVRALDVETIERVRRAVEALPPAQRETVRLRFYAGLRIDEIAEARGTAPGTIKATLHQAIEKLRRELRRDE